MTLAELLENVVFAATLNAYEGAATARDDRVEVMAHLFTRMALLVRYCPRRLWGGELQRVAALAHSLEAQRRGEQEYFERWKAQRLEVASY